MLQVRSFGWKAYARDPWNWVECISFVTYFIGFGLQHGNSVEFGEAARIFRAFSFMAFAYQIVRYGSIFETFGVLIPVLSKMIRELLRFICAMIVFIITFAIASHAILCPNDTLDAQILTRIFTQRWLFLFGYSSYEEFTGNYFSPRYFNN